MPDAVLQRDESLAMAEDAIGLMPLPVLQRLRCIHPYINLTVHTSISVAQLRSQSAAAIVIVHLLCT